MENVTLVLQPLVQSQTLRTGNTTGALHDWLTQMETGPLYVRFTASHLISSTENQQCLYFHSLFWLHDWTMKGLMQKYITGFRLGNACIAFLTAKTGVSGVLPMRIPGFRWSWYWPVKKRAPAPLTFSYLLMLNNNWLLGEFTPSLISWSTLTQAEITNTADSTTQAPDFADKYFRCSPAKRSMALPSKGGTPNERWISIHRL